MLTDTNAIGQRIRQFRKEKGLSQTELAEKIGKSLRTVQKYEKGEIEVSLSTIGDIGAALDVLIEKILIKTENCKECGKKETDSSSTFAVRLCELLEEWEVTQLVLAKAVGVSRQSIGQWKSGKTVPDVLDLRKIADFFEVSTDYLLGRTDIRAQEPEIRSVCGKIGLSDASVQMLARLKKENNPRLCIINLLLEQADDDISDDYEFDGIYEGSVLNAVCRYLDGTADRLLSMEFDDYEADRIRYVRIRSAVRRLIFDQAVEAIKAFDEPKTCHS